jgi:hypothetical protein
MGSDVGTVLLVPVIRATSRCRRLVKDLLTRVSIKFNRSIGKFGLEELQYLCVNPLFPPPSVKISTKTGTFVRSCMAPTRGYLWLHETKRYLQHRERKENIYNGMLTNVPILEVLYKASPGTKPKPHSLSKISLTSRYKTIVRPILSCSKALLTYYLYDRSCGLMNGDLPFDNPKFTISVRNYLVILRENYNSGKSCTFTWIHFREVVYCLYLIPGSYWWW